MIILALAKKLVSDMIFACIDIDLAMKSVDLYYCMRCLMQCGVGGVLVP